MAMLSKLFSVKKTPKVLFQLPKPLHLHLLVVQLFTILLLVSELSAWMLALIALSLLWQLTHLLMPNRKGTPRLVVVLFALTGAGIIILFGKSLGLLSSMVHLIAFAYGIKSLEMKARKDFYQLILLGIFLQACAFIFIQSIWFAILVLTAVTVNLSLLYRLFAGAASASEGNVVNSTKTSATLLLYSVPLAAALFVFFPRLSPFWKVPLANTAKTGLGSEVRPGDIAKLAQSNELAFRVEFNGSAPSKSQMYWRAMTMPYYDGRQWSRSDGRNIPHYLRTPVDVAPLAGNNYQYQVMVEANNRHWLFALDTPQTTNNAIVHLFDYSLLHSKPITKTFSYQVTSFPDVQKGLNLTERFKAFYLRIPEDSNPKLTALGRELAQRYTDKRALINHILSQYRQQPYFYTLEPPRLVNNSLDQFYFETRSGFCEHYASSFAFLMRAAGIPARLVTGYLGGEYNQQGNYYSVYQFDAHAWTEVWLAGQGWVLVDPTSAVSPERVSDDMSNLLRQERVNLAGNFSWEALSSAAWIAKIRMQIEAVDYQWNRLVLSYSLDKQSKLLSALLGEGRFWKATLIMMLALSLVMAMFWLKELMPRTKKRAKWQKAFDDVLGALEKVGVKRDIDQTPKSLIILLNDKNTELGKQYELVYSRYQALSYQQLSLEKHTKLAISFIKDCRILCQHIEQQV